MAELSHISHIFLDLDDTLIATRKAVRSGVRAAAQAMESAGAPLSAGELEELILNKIIPVVSSLNRQELFEVTAYELDMVGDELESVGFSAYSAEVDTIPPFPETIPTLNRLHEAGKVLSIISNGSLERQHHKLWASGLAHFFKERVFLPQSVNPPFYKPNTNLFRHAIAKTGADPASSIMVGDRNIDMLGAKIASMTTVGIKKVDHGHFDPLRDGNIRATQPDFIIATLPELLPLLGLEPL